MAPCRPVFFAAASAVLSFLAFLDAASEELVTCSDILYLVEQSRSQFVAIRRETSGDVREYGTTFDLPQAWSCLIFDDVKKRSYKCTWKYPYGDEQAHNTFQRLVREMRNCVGNLADEQTDQPVNHPDFYASHYYQLPGSEARVTLKNKGKLMNTFVSIVIDGFKKPNISNSPNRVRVHE